jgi:4-amino-4-deoxy-L-arabinose transferase-like glycosyltransferase
LSNFLSYSLVSISYENIGPLQIFYFGFNSIEAIAWFIFAAYVLSRWVKHRKSNVEILYSLSFLLFGITDILELDKLPVWLLLVKGVILVSILLARHHLLKNHYPDAKF